MPRLKRSDCSGKGIARRKAGKGFTYVDSEGHRVKKEDVSDRIKVLAIPPAWEDVWICPWDNGHIQATGIDAAGRKQYLYHEQWTSNAASKKFDEVLNFSRRLPALREVVHKDISLDKMPIDRALACAVRMMDLGFFRIGSEQYAEENETYGVATILREHVILTGKEGVRFEYSAKGSKDRVQDISDREVRKVAEDLLKRRGGADDFLAFKDGRRWKNLKSGDINAYIQRHAGENFSAKDFRTWNGTVLAAFHLGTVNLPDSKRDRDRAIKDAVAFVAEHLGNTPAVSRSSYIDPRVLDRFRNGRQLRLPARKPELGSVKDRTVIERKVRDLIENN